jgi:imidazolonepropionase-like amidohydrolase
MSDLLLKNATLINVATGELTPNTSILIEDGKIKEVAVGHINKGATQVIDVKGKYIMPGLCDAHVHVTAATHNFADLSNWSPYYTTARAGDIMKAMLMRGFTTVRDAGGADFGLAQASAEGYLPGPRLLFCGKALSQTGGHGDMRSPGMDVFDSCPCCSGLGRICDGVSEVRKACRDELRKGANHIKIMASGGASSPTDRVDSTQFSIEEITAAVEEATAANRYVMAHAYTARAANRVLECGVRSLEHGNLIDDSTRKLLLEKDAFLVPTMATHQSICDAGAKAGFPTHMLDKFYMVVEAGKINHAESHRQGVKMAFATDLLGVWHSQQLTEFKLRSEFQTPLEVIQSATINAAELFDMKDQIGEIKAGAYADLIVLDSNPLEDLNVMQNPDRFLKFIAKEGVIYKNQL